MNQKQAILNARRLGYLVTTFDAKEVQEQWLTIATEEGFPYVCVMAQLGTPITTKVGVAWDTSHLWNAISKRARELGETSAVLHAGAECRMAKDTAGVVAGGTMRMDDAQRLASRIIGLTGHKGSAA